MAYKLLFEKKARVIFRKGLFALVFFVFVFLLYNAIASHTITTSSGGTSYNVNEDVGFIYNISVNNSDDGQDANITQVNITLPSGFSFNSGVEGTDAFGAFSNSGNNLSWSNFTEYLVNGSSINYFWFNATAATPGNYNITIMTLNASGANYHNISVVVNDTTPPGVSLVFPLNGGNYSVSNLSFNISLSDATNVSSCWFSLTNGATNYTMTLNSSRTGANFTNSSIGETIYTAKYYCNDTLGYLNNSVNVTFRIDRTAPDVELNSPSDGATIGDTKNFTFTPDDNGGSGIKSCTLYIDDDEIDTLENLNSGTKYGIQESGMDDGSHDWYVKCIDYVNREGTSETRDFTVDGSSDSDDNNNAASSTSTTTASWKGSYSYSDTDFSQKSPYTRELLKDYRIVIKLGGVNHHIGVRKLTSSVATIEVASTPKNITLSVGEQKKVEITDDNFYDVLIKLNGIANSTRANLTISYLHEAIPGAPQNSSGNQTNNPSVNSTGTGEGAENLTGTSGESKENTINVLTGILIFIGVIALVVVGYLIYRKQKRGY